MVASPVVVPVEEAEKAGRDIDFSDFYINFKFV